MDLALTATYFPQHNLTFAIVFGCPLVVEEEVIRRLSFAMEEASHPLLMPGIFAELERARHIQIVEATVDELEKRIFELDFQSSKMEAMAVSDSEIRNQEKRTAWLDTTYLRNALLSWNTQLAKISQHAIELKETLFRPAKATLRHADDAPALVDMSRNKFKYVDTHSAEQTQTEEWVDLEHDEIREEDLNGDQSDIAEIGIQRRPLKSQRGSDNALSQPTSESVKAQLRRGGHKIKDRIEAIIDEYDDKIRDCTMRVDGMAMATQWVRFHRNKLLSPQRD
jgi:hypothetical protein